jgi:hypothetical protein
MRLRVACSVMAFVAALAIAGSTPAVVIRDDVPDGAYRVPASAFPALVDLPGEGHGVLIAPRWVVTAAHAVRFGRVAEVTIKGVPRAVKAKVVHDGFAMPGPELLKGDAAPLMAFLRNIDDIALLELEIPVTDVAPVAIYRGTDEKGKVATIYGKGATGNGLTGQLKDAPHRGELRRANNLIDAVDPRWIGYTFDRGAAALPLEGQLGDGDSGGPVLIDDGGNTVLAGLADWKMASGDVDAFHPGIYGQHTFHVRLSSYARWIDRTMAAAVKMETAEVDRAEIQFRWATLGADASETYTLTRDPTGYVLQGGQQANDSIYEDDQPYPVTTKAEMSGRRGLGQVKALLDVLRAPAIRRDTALRKLADDDWARYNVQEAYASLDLWQCAEMQRLFAKRFLDARYRLKGLAAYYDSRHTDDYPSYQLSVKLTDGKVIVAKSNVQAVPAIVWSVDGVETWNADIPEKIAALLPPWSTMGQRVDTPLAPRRFARLIADDDAFHDLGLSCDPKH